MRLVSGLTLTTLTILFLNAHYNEQQAKRGYTQLQRDYTRLQQDYTRLYSERDKSISMDQAIAIRKESWDLGVRQTINHVEWNAAYPSDKWIDEMKQVIVLPNYEDYKREYKKLEPKYDPDFKPQPLQLASDSVLR